MATPVEATATTAVGTFVAQSAYASSGLEIRATSGVAEASISGGDLRATGAAAEVAQSGGSVRATGAAAEVAQSGGNVRATGTTAEALQSGGSLRASAIVVEVLTEWPPVVEVEVSTATATFTAGTAAAEAVVQVTTDAVTAVGTLVAGTPTTTSTVPIVTTASTAILTAVVPSVLASAPSGGGSWMFWRGKLLFRRRFGGKVAVDPQCCCGCMNCCDKPSTITMDVTGALECTITLTKIGDCDDATGRLVYQGVVQGVDPAKWCNGTTTGYEGDPINVEVTGFLECSTDVDGRQYWVMSVTVTAGPYPKCITLGAVVDSWTCTPFEFFGHDFTNDFIPGLCNCGDRQRIDIHIHE